MRKAPDRKPTPERKFTDTYPRIVILKITNEQYAALKRVSKALNSPMTNIYRDLLEYYLPDYVKHQPQKTHLAKSLDEALNTPPEQNLA